MKKDRKLHYVTFRPIVQVLSAPWVPSEKVNCRPWGTVHIAQSTSDFKNRFSLGIQVDTPCTHSRLMYFKHDHKQTNMELKTNKVHLFHDRICCLGPIT